MRKLLSLACLAFALASCGGDGGASSSETASPSSADITWTITFEVNGGSPVDPIKVKHGEKASAPENPIKEGAVFDAWYVDEVCVTPFDWETEITADWTLYAGYEEEGEDIPDESSSDISGSSESSTDPSEESSSSSSEEGHDPVPLTIYFRDASWWNNMGAETHILINGETGLGETMEWLRYCLTDYNVGYNYWSYTFEDITGVETISFLRAGYNDGVLNDWGAATVEIELDSRLGHNMYDISSTSAAWKGDGDYVMGVWADYDPDDMGNENLDDSAYIVGSGSFVTEEWTIEGGIKMEENPSNENEMMALGVSLEEGDQFKVTCRGNWLGYSAIKDDSPVKSTNFEAGEGDNIVVTASGDFDMYYDISAGTIYIAASAS